MFEVSPEKELRFIYEKVDARFQRAGNHVEKDLGLFRKEVESHLWRSSRNILNGVRVT